MIRFKKEDGLNYPDIQEKKLGEIALLSSSKRVYANEYVDVGIPFYRGKEISELQSNKEISDILYISKDKFEELKNKYGAPVKGDILITAVGTLGNTWVVDNENPFYFKDGNLIWLREIKEDSYYLNYIFNSPKGKKRIIDSAIGSNQKALTIVKLSELEFSFPCKDEQKKISDFLSSVDDIIQIQAEEIAALEEQKKGIMQKLFNREVRFKADDGSEYPEWDERTFDEIFNVIQNNTFSRDCLNNEIGEVLNIHYGDVLIKYGAFIDVSKEEVPHINDNIQLNKFDEKSYLRNGDIIIADTAEDMTVGKATEICGAIGKKILSGLHTIPCRPKVTFVSKYLGYYINSEKYHNQLVPLIQGIKVSSISKSNISKTVIIYPCAEEQKKIADYLSTYDEAIQIKKNKLEVWKEIKKGLLQQMFV